MVVALLSFDTFGLLLLHLIAKLPSHTYVLEGKKKDSRRINQIKHFYLEISY